MKISSKNAQETLLERAIALSKSGISVIPVCGDSSPTQPKKAAIKWREYQRRIMDQAEVKAAFSGDSRALGIVCGQVSRLIVVDFDDHLRYQRFCRNRPDLAKSVTVKTRRGYHVYFRTDAKTPTHQFNGGDIKGEGSYVVAPPSIIDGVRYAVVSKERALELDESGVDGLLNFLHEGNLQGLRRHAGRQDCGVVNLKLTYARLASQLGRNNALYRVASSGRDRGMSRAQVERELLMAHVMRESRDSHGIETAEERLSEARRTIASAFRARRRGGPGKGSGLPNSVREMLLREQRSSLCARFLDLLFLAGWESESYFRMIDGIRLGKTVGLDRKGVMQVLTGELSTFNGSHIVARRYVEYTDIRGLNDRRRGRPVELVFQAPSLGRLLTVLGVGLSPSDEVGLEDLKSARRYRLALHRGYIRRMAPRVSVRVLADRIGVSARTIRRYNQELQVRSTACVGRFELTWDRLSCLPRRRRGDRRRATAGFWLETAEGYRAPAWRHIAAVMLRRGELGLEVCLRRVSQWSLSPEPCATVEFERLSPEEFVQLRLQRELRGKAGLGKVATRLLDRARSLLGKVRHERVRLSFDSVSVRIAEDKVADSIGGVLVALDEQGREVRRPARRGVAYRMLKEFGNGNVFLLLRDSLRETLAVMAGHAARAGFEERSLSVMAPLLS